MIATPDQRPAVDRSSPLAALARVAAILVVSSVALTGCVQVVGRAPGAEPTVVETAGSDDEPAATDDLVDVYERDVELPAELATYQQMSPADFADLPVAEKWLYVSWLTQFRDEFRANFGANSASYYDSFPPVEPGSPAIDLMVDASYTLRYAYLMTEGTPIVADDKTCGTLDEDSFRKIFATLYLDNATFSTRGWADHAVADTGGRSLCPAGLQYDWYNLPAGSNLTSEARTTVDFEGRQVEMTTVVYTDRSGGEVTAEYYAVPVTTFDGRTEYHTVIDVVDYGDTYSAYFGR